MKNGAFQTAFPGSGGPDLSSATCLNEAEQDKNSRESQQDVIAPHPTALR